MRNFNLLATQVFVQPLLDVMHTKPELWNLFNDRQNYPGSAHADTRTIMFYGPETIDPWSWFNVLGVKPYPAFYVFHDAFLQTTNLVSLALRSFRCVEAGRAMLVSLKAGGKIKPHVDEGPYVEHYQRLHLVLSGSCDFHCSDETVTMRPGELWWFDHHKEHWVENNAEEPRINLILDARFDTPISRDYP